MKPQQLFFPSTHATAIATGMTAKYFTGTEKSVAIGHVA
jgi:hypothetical protein